MFMRVSAGRRHCVGLIVADGPPARDTLSITSDRASLGRIRAAELFGLLLEP